MVTKRDDDDRRQGEYRAICLWKMDWQSFAISEQEVFPRGRVIAQNVEQILTTLVMTHQLIF